MKIKITVKKLQFRMSYFAPRFIDENYVFLSKVRYLGDANDSYVFLATKLIPAIGKRNLVTSKIRASNRFQKCEFPIDAAFYIPFKHFLKMRNTLC